LKASYNGYVDIVRALLQAGLNVDLAYGNGYGQTALMAGIIDYF
jgi:ankyrin repeat protein